MQRPSRVKRLIHRLMAFDRQGVPVEKEEFTLTCPGLPTAFVGARVAIVADLHLPDGLLTIAELIQCVTALHPDAIFLPGDLTNSYTEFDAEGLRQLAAGLAEIAPCFAIPGNHELRLEREPLYREILVDCGITYLCDSFAVWQRNGESLRLYGMGANRDLPKAEPDHAFIALAHRPEYFRDYCRAGWSLVISGHAHGGQMRLGRLALFAPGQGFFPRYTGGLYERKNTVMLVSRGLGNSSLPWRVKNAPHLPVIVLQRV